MAEQQIQRQYGVVALILLTLVLAAAIALIPISGGPQPPWKEGAQTPYGYAWSLALFLVPLGVLVVWLERNRQRFAFRRRAFWTTVGITCPLAVLLDIFLGNTFFVWPNTDAYLGFYFPGYNFGGAGWTLNIPIEEVIFYLAGIIFMLLSYVWASTSWVPAYSFSENEYRHDSSPCR